MVCANENADMIMDLLNKIKVEKDDLNRKLKEQQMNRESKDNYCPEKEKLEWMKVKEELNQSQMKIMELMTDINQANKSAEIIVEEKIQVYKQQVSRLEKQNADLTEHVVTLEVENSKLDDEMEHLVEELCDKKDPLHIEGHDISFDSSSNDGTLESLTDNDDDDDDDEDNDEDGNDEDTVILRQELCNAKANITSLTQERNASAEQVSNLSLEVSRMMSEIDNLAEQQVNYLENTTGSPLRRRPLADFSLLSQNTPTRPAVVANILHYLTDNTAQRTEQQQEETIDDQQRVAVNNTEKNYNGINTSESLIAKPPPSLWGTSSTSVSSPGSPRRDWGSPIRDVANDSTILNSPPNNDDLIVGFKDETLAQDDEGEDSASFEDFVSNVFSEKSSPPPAFISKISKSMTATSLSGQSTASSADSAIIGKGSFNIVVKQVTPSSSSHTVSNKKRKGFNKLVRLWNNRNDTYSKS